MVLKGDAEKKSSISVLACWRMSAMLNGRRASEDAKGSADAKVTRCDGAEEL